MNIKKAFIVYFLNMFFIKLNAVENVEKINDGLALQKNKNI